MADDEMVAWLSATLDDIERIARRAADPFDEDEDAAWQSNPDKLTDGGASEEYAEAVAPHIALNDPRAVLARVEAERRLIGAYTTPDLDPAVMVDVLRVLAYGHRFDAPGYRDEWRP